MLGEEFENGEGYVVESQFVLSAIRSGDLRKMRQVWLNKGPVLALLEVSTGRGFPPVEFIDGPSTRSQNWGC